MRLCITIIGLFLTYAIYSQTIVINEVCSSNTLLFDANRNTPDWIEIFNNADTSISLEGYKLTDRKQAIEWEFNAVTIPPKEFLIVYASGENRISSEVFSTIIKKGADWSYIIPDGEISEDWMEIEYDDSSWPVGPSGIGYGDNDDSTITSNGISSVFMRKVFSIEDIDNIIEVLFHMDFDDGFVAYINGIEIARENLGNVGQLMSPETFADIDHEAKIYSGGFPDEFEIANYKDILSEGENILAVQVHNVSKGSSDLTSIPILTLVKESGENDVDEVLNFGDAEFHTDFKISSGGDSLYLMDDEQRVLESLGIPPLPPNASFGRTQDGSESFTIFGEGTPGATNSGVSYQGVIENEVNYSHESGIYNAGFVLTLESEEGTIKYTVDGSIPAISSKTYTNPIVINKNLTVKAKVFKEGFLSHLISSRSYLINENHELPSISISIKPDDLYNNDTGIYVLGDDYQEEFPYFGANFWEDWERSVHFSYFDEAGTELFRSGAGLKIFGGWSRAVDQRSMSIFARSIYGNGSFDFPFFENRPYDQYESIVLRNSGNDWNYSMFRDVMMTSLTKPMGLEVQAYQPVVTYLNGEYWGIYNLREKVNEHYLASLFDLNPLEINLLEGNGGLITGNSRDYSVLKDFISSNILTSDENYEIVANQIDIENFIQYQVAQIYFDNRDWPGNNIKYWNTENRKWRWILYDTDFGFSLYGESNFQYNSLRDALSPYGPNWPNPPWSTLFLRKLTQNQEFRNLFINYFADALNSHFLPETVHTKIDSCSSLILPEIGNHFSKWNGNSNSFFSNISKMKNFATQRPNYMRGFIKSQFNLFTEYDVTLENRNPDKGSVKINSLNIPDAEWKGIYFSQVPITITAIPKPGYVFAYWTGDASGNETSKEITLTGDKTFVAHFKTSIQAEDQIVINEINYNSSPELDAGDWIELYNYGNNDVNIGGWVFKDSENDHEYILPENSIIQRKNFIIISRSPTKFKSVYPDVVSPILGPFDFGLSSVEDEVRLFNVNEDIKDSVHYLSVAPWPENANGTGSTLELIAPELDNSLPSSWMVEEPLGTPGTHNTNSVSTQDYEISRVAKVFPNPTEGRINVQWNNSILAREIQIFDLSGKMIYSKSLPISSVSDLKINLSEMEPGIYLLRINGDKGIATSKVTIL